MRHGDFDLADFFPVDDTEEELISEVREERVRYKQWLAHPDPRDPDYPYVDDDDYDVDIEGVLKLEEDG